MNIEEQIRMILQSKASLDVEGDINLVEMAEPRFNEAISELTEFFELHLDGRSKRKNLLIFDVGTDVSLEKEEELKNMNMYNLNSDKEEVYLVSLMNRK